MSVWLTLLSACCLSPEVAIQESTVANMLICGMLSEIRIWTLLSWHGLSVLACMTKPNCSMKTRQYMKRALFGIAAVVTLAVISPAKATTFTVTFDNLATPNDNGGQHWGSFSGYYAGLVWQAGWEVANEADFRSVYGNTGVAPSAPNIAYNDTGALHLDVSDGQFYFNGAYVRSWGQYDTLQGFSSRSVTVDGYLGSALVGTTSINLSAANYTYLPGISTLVDRLVWRNDGVEGHWFVMDNLQYTVPGAPDGGLTAMLLGAGLLAVGLVRRMVK